jgi:hypothetical protein
MSKLRGRLLTTLVSLGTLLGARGCGGVTDDRVAAREKTTSAICDRYAQCGLIGAEANAAYPNREACVIDWRADRDEAWPAADCQGKISQPELNVCLAAVAATNCVGFDFVGTLLKCTPATVCSGGSRPDASGN